MSCEEWVGGLWGFGHTLPEALSFHLEIISWLSKRRRSGPQEWKILDRPRLLLFSMAFQLTVERPK